MSENDKILELKNVVYSFRTYGGEVKAVRDVSFEVRKGEILGIVGESGCGKSVTAQCIMRLNPEPPGFFEGGEIFFNGKDILKMNKKELRNIRGRDIGFVFQDPMTSLNPTMRIGKQIEEVFLGRTDISKSEVKEKALEIMKLVGISDVEKRYRQYPHELSGGMRQRVMIAIAMCCRPGLLIADEPTTALDVTIQAQILELMAHMKNEFQTSVILITHDLGVISSMCTRVIVMYGGLIMEEGAIEDIFYRTGHPYTAGLLASIPQKSREKLVPIYGTPPDLLNPPAGCPFAARCPHAMKLCAKCQPQFFDLGGGHRSACWLHHPSVKAQKGEVKLG